MVKIVPAEHLPASLHCEQVIMNPHRVSNTTDPPDVQVFKLIMSVRMFSPDLCSATVLLTQLHQSETMMPL